jgi:hypothetical protein
LTVIFISGASHSGEKREGEGEGKGGLEGEGGAGGVRGGGRDRRGRGYGGEDGEMWSGVEIFLCSVSMICFFTVFSVTHCGK